MNQEELIRVQALEVYKMFTRENATLATAESCTGGWVAQAITSVPGSSAVFDCGFVTYSNAAKQRLLGVSAELLSQFGAVSAQTAIAMAEGALIHSTATLSVSTTGIAGPAGGSSEKPVGLVWFAWAMRNQPTVSEQQIFQGDRESIRAQAVLYAITGLKKILSS